MANTMKGMRALAKPNIRRFSCSGTNCTKCLVCCLSTSGKRFSLRPLSFLSMGHAATVCRPLFVWIANTSGDGALVSPFG